MDLTRITLLPAALVLLTLVNHGSALESALPPRSHRLIYKGNSSGDLQYCHLCTRKYYTMKSFLSEPCLRENRDEVYQVNGTDYKPWCEAGVGLMPTCAVPEQLSPGWLECGKLGMLVYEECSVHCPKYHRAQTATVTCQEEDLRWNSQPTCVVSECPPWSALEPFHITCEGEGPSQVGGQCNVTCPEGFRPDRPTVMCQTNGTWATTPQCMEDQLPLSGGGSPGVMGEQKVWLTILLVTGSVAAALIGVSLYVRHRRQQRRKYSVALIEERLGQSVSSRELPAVPSSRPELILSWSSISSLFRALFTWDSPVTEAGQNRWDAEAGSGHYDMDAEGEAIEMLSNGQGSGEEMEDQELGQEEHNGNSMLPMEESPLLSTNGGIVGQGDEEPGGGNQQQEEEGGTANGGTAEAGGSSYSVAAEAHSTSGDLESHSSASEEREQAFSDKLDPYSPPPKKFDRRSRSPIPSDWSNPTYLWNLQEHIGFKVTFNNGDDKMLPMIVERDTQIRVTKGQEIQISAKCQDHDDEVENFNVQLWNMTPGRGNISKESTSNSFRFRACLISAIEIYILSAQTSKTRRNHMVRFTVYTPERETNPDDPEETSPKQRYAPPMPCSSSNLYTPLPQHGACTTPFSNSNNKTFAQKGDVLPSVNFLDKDLPGRAMEVPGRGTLECSQPLYRLCEETELDQMTKLLDKLEPIPSRKEAETIYGLYLHYLPDRRDHVDVVCWAKQTDRHSSPARVLLEEMSQEGFYTGHLTRYFAHPAHSRQDVLQLLWKVHPLQSCPSCQTLHDVL